MLPFPVAAPAEAGQAPCWTLTLPDEAATSALARFLADTVRPGDLVTLSGGLGSGKTTLARALVRILADDPALDVPSPTFTLIQGYDTPRGPVVHADFYRLSGPGELAELGWDELTEPALTLVEWPDRAERLLPPSRLDVGLDLALDVGPGARRATLTGQGAFGDRLARAVALQAMLAGAGWEEARRTLLQGDASTRLYERLTKPSGESAILMVSPARPDGPPVRRGLPYSAVARLAESVHAFVALDRGLRALGFSAPRILGEDLDAGLLLLEDFGTGAVVDGQGPEKRPIPERYEEATRLLARLHATTLPNILPVAEGRDHVLPPYDLEAMLIEVDLLLDWYAPHIAGLAVPSAARTAFAQLWGEVLAPVQAAPTTWTLRDYHSPNLMWLPGRGGLARVGLLDFQDAVLGPPAYDVASLLQDARVTVPAELELRLLGVYARERRILDPAFDFGSFAEAYAVMGAQRATKVAGIFARLDRRDGKPAYLQHLPRIETYLQRNLSHPALTGLKLWYESHLPRLVAADESIFE